MMKRIVNILVIIVSFSLTLFITLFIGNSIVLLLDFDLKNYEMDKSWKECIGVLSEVATDRSHSQKFSYNFEGVEYESFTYVNVSNDIVGSKYCIKVNPKKPTKIIPLEWKPIFTSDEKQGLQLDESKNLKKSLF